MKWISSIEGHWTYFAIESTPPNIWFIKHSLRRTFKMVRGQWKEVDVCKTLATLQLEWEVKWKNNQIKFENCVEKKIEHEHYPGPNFMMEEEEEGEKKRKKRKFLKK